MNPADQRRGDSDLAPFLASADGSGWAQGERAVRSTTLEHNQIDDHRAFLEWIATAGSALLHSFKSSLGPGAITVSRIDLAATEMIRCLKRQLIVPSASRATPAR